jgi:hypothetical protein
VSRDGGLGFGSKVGRRLGCVTDSLGVAAFRFFRFWVRGVILEHAEVGGGVSRVGYVCFEGQNKKIKK